MKGLIKMIYRHLTRIVELCDKDGENARAQIKEHAKQALEEMTMSANDRFEKLMNNDIPEWLNEQADRAQTHLDKASKAIENLNDEDDTKGGKEIDYTTRNKGKSQ